MSRKRYTTEQIIKKLREAEVTISLHARSARSNPTAFASSD